MVKEGMAFPLDVDGIVSGGIKKELKWVAISVSRGSSLLRESNLHPLY